MNRVLLALGLLCVGLFLIGRALDLSWLILVAKPVPVLLLALLQRLGAPGRARVLVAVGMVLSAVGDVVLEPVIDLFVPGLVAFLLAHLAYIAAFLSWSRKPALPGLVIFGAWGLSAFSYLQPGLGELVVPVLAYCLVISTMGWRATALVGVRSQRSALLLVLGAASFMLSDTVLAIDKFHSPVPMGSWIIMGSYWLGQAGIGIGAVLGGVSEDGGPRSPA